MKRAIGLFLTCLVGCGADDVATEDEPVTTVAPGISYGVRTSNGRQAHVVLFDYARPTIDLRTTNATNPSEAYERVSDWASRVPHMAVAINGGIWDRAHDGNDCGQTMAGLNMHDHTEYTHDGQFTSFVLVKDGKDVRMQTGETNVEQPDTDWRDAVSANTVLVANGHVVPCNDTNICPEVTSRTAVGLDRTKHLMWFFVTKTPMNLTELAHFIVDTTLAESAVNLDGGGSSTLWIRGLGVVNKAASSQRTVCNHFGVIAN